jgi:hypothetical protein
MPESENKINRILEIAHHPLWPELPLRHEPELMDAYCEWACEEFASRVDLLKNESLLSLLHVRNGVHFDCMNRVRADLNGLIVEAGGIGPRRFSEVIARSMNEMLELKQSQILCKQRPAEESTHPPRTPKRAKNSTYSKIDECLKEIEKSKPRRHADVFAALDGRLPVPDCEPFRSAKGWSAGYRTRPDRARAWLSGRWSRLNLPPFRPGPKKLFE